MPTTAPGAGGTVIYQYAGFVRPAPTRAEIEAWAQQPDGDQRLAAALLDAGLAAGEKGVYLAAGYTPECHTAGTGFGPDQRLPLLDARH